MVDADSLGDDEKLSMLNSRIVAIRLNTALFLLMCCVAMTTTAAQHQFVDVFIRDDVYEDYKTFVGERDVNKIKDFTGKTMRRDVADLVLLHQALQLGGFHKRFRYQSGKVTFRNTRLLESGNLLLSFDTYWLADAKAMADKVFISDPVIRNGEYLAGIYASPSNSGVFRIHELTDLQRFSAVSTPKWRTDWLTLQSLPLQKLVREDEWLSQARMVSMRWIDFMLMPFFHDSDGHYRLENIHLKVVPGVAILLADSRHFVVSRKHPDGEAAYKALNRGLKILRQNGQLEKMYLQAGFLIPPGKLKILNAPLVKPTQQQSTF